MKTANKNSKKVVKTTAKKAEKPEVVTKRTAQLSAAQLPAAQLPAETAKVREQPTWQGKPISAAGLVYHQRREAGVCVKCGQPLAEGSKLLCTKHLEYHNKWHGDRKAKAEAAQAEAAKVVLENAALKAQIEALTAPKSKARKSK